MVTAEHEALRETVRALLDRTAASDLVRASDGYCEPLWRALAEQVGVAGLTVPEQYDGAAATLLATHIVLEETGRTLAPVPVLGSLLAAQALIRGGTDEARARLLPQIAAGAVATVGWQDDGYVLDGDIADITLMISGDNLYEIVPTHRERKPTMDFTRRLASVEFDLTQASHLGAAPPQLRDIARAALSAEQVGTAQRCLDMTVDYTKTRVQFGRPIGSFQALKHRMADMYVLVETARSISYAAAEDLSLASTAKVHCSEALSTVAGEMIQLHGGIAITWEHDAHLYFKRAHGSRQLFGGPTGLRSSLRAVAR